MSELKDSWDEVLELAACIAREFRGRVKVYSHELTRWGEERQLERASSAVHVLAMTPEIAPKDFEPSSLLVKEVQGVKCYIATPTWQDVLNPSEESIREIIKVYESVADAKPPT